MTASPTTPATPNASHVIGMLAWRELVRFFRQRHRVFGALGQPLVFWLLFGVGLHRTFRLSDAATDQSFLQYFFPGTLVLVLLFTAIFATISVIEDRREGFLQSVLVAPITRWAMVLGKIFGGSAIAMVHALVFLGLMFFLPVEFQFGRFLGLLAFLLLASVGLTSLGFALAWRLDSTQGFHAVMNVLLLPMWLLSGAFFPVPVPESTELWSQSALYWCMRVNPLTYCVAGVRYLLYQGSAWEAVWMPSWTACWLVTASFALGMFAIAWMVAGGRTRGDLL